MDAKTLDQLQELTAALQSITKLVDEIEIVSHNPVITKQIGLLANSIQQLTEAVDDLPA